MVISATTANWMTPSARNAVKPARWMPSTVSSNPTAATTPTRIAAESAMRPIVRIGPRFLRSGNEFGLSWGDGFIRSMVLQEGP
jgi:hypothetical protein